MYAGKWLKDLSCNEAHGCWGVAPELREHLLADLNGAQWLLRGEVDLMPYVEAIETASPEVLETARPQLFQALEMVKVTMRDRHFQHDYQDNGLLNRKDSAEEIVAAVLDQTLVEGRSHLVKAMREPSNERWLASVAAAMTTLAEAKVITGALGFEGNAAASAWHRQATEAFAEIAAGVERLRDGVGALYADTVRAIIPAPSEAEAQAIATVQTELARGIDHLTPRVLKQGVDLSGNWEPGERMKYGLGETEKPLSPERLEELRALTAAVLAEYDTVFHRPGFVNLLRQASVMSRDEAMKTVDRETVHNLQLDAESRKADYVKQKKHYYRQNSFVARMADMTVNEHAAEIAGRERAWLTKSQRYLALAESVDSFLAKAALALGVEPPVKRVRMEKVGDVVLLRPDGAASVFAIYPDDRKEHESFANAVWAAKMPAERVADGLPSLDEVKAADWALGTNFHNLEDALVSLREPIMQERIFGGRVVVENAADFVPPRPPRKEKELDDQICF